MKRAGLKSRLKQGDVIANAWLTVPSAFAAEAAAHSGVDAVTVDMQHAPIDVASMVTMLQAVSAAPAVPLVRVGSHDPAAAMQVLDAGAMGVICPLIDTPEQAASFVRACRYPPEGGRSWGPTRAKFAHGGYDRDVANDEILTFAMIETPSGLENLSAIAQTAGLDGLFVGPVDLSLNLTGRPVVDLDNGPLTPAIERVIQACHDHGLIPGVFASTGAEAVRMRNLGFRFVTVGADAAHMTRGLTRATQELTSG
jgi:4-hydroxy-2-oxoheptanedioate aldolase